MEQQLPIYEILPLVRETLAQHNTVVLQAPPGAGKSTVLPIELRAEPWLGGKKILMLEPRRLAARAVAQRMAATLGEDIAQTVGYRVRFENRTSAHTLVEVLTEGILTRLLQQDNALEEVGMVIFDEFHERSLHADLALALCRQVQQLLRPDLRILVMSATMDTALLATRLGGAPVLHCEGRQFAVEHIYLPAEDAPIPQQMARVIRRALYSQEGDVLAFLPGAGEIQRTAELLDDLMPQMKVLPLYGDLPRQQQDEALLPDPGGRRKIVLATSIAETSLTIEGIRIVVDSGLARVPRFDPRSGFTRLEIVQVTRDAADQRAGRAGRLGPGVCFRLWSEGAHLHLTAHRKPEILEADLAPTMLELAQWGVNEVSELEWVTAPPPGAVKQALELLHDLEAIEQNKITPRGKEMLRLPTHPRLAHLLLEGQALNRASLAADVAALLEERDPLPRGSGADLSLRVELLRKWRSKERVNADRGSLEKVEKLATAWRRLLKCEVENQMPDASEVGLLIAAAYPERVARQRDGQQGKYKLAQGRGVKLDMHDSLVREQWLAVAQLDAGLQEGQIYLAAPVEPATLHWLIHETERIGWDEKNGNIVAQKEKRIGDLLVSAAPLKEISEAQRVAILCQAVAGNHTLLDWDEKAMQWQARVLSLRHWRSEEAWPDVSREALLSRTQEWLAPFLASVKSRDGLGRLNVVEMLQASLPWELASRLDTLAPVNLAVPSGSLIKIEYQLDGSPPVLAVRLQEVFGLLDTPTVNEGRTQVMMHLLSPAHRPVQVTQDLRSFWQNTYHEVRKELRMRYPKHFWPDDPWTAEAVRGVKRKK